MTYPTINEYELEQVAQCLEVINPGRASASHIADMIRASWPFANIATAGWVAYAESPDTNNNVRVALTPYSVHLYLTSIQHRLLPAQRHAAFCDKE